VLSSSHHVGGNNSYQAVVAKHCIAWQDIKQYPNTCNYFEPTESQLWLIGCAGFTAKDATKLLVTTIGHAVAAWKK